MKMEAIKNWCTRLLVGFVLVSLGFALGRDVTQRRLRSPQTSTPPVGAAINAPLMPAGRIQAYYLHGTIRCVSCNQIERTAKQLLDSEFAKELADGRLTWREVNFEREPALAKRYNVAASTLVLVKEVNGKEVAFRRLDDVWTLAEKPAALQAYIRQNIQELRP
jgi:hypothetical protein